MEQAKTLYREILESELLEEVRKTLILKGWSLHIRVLLQRGCIVGQLVIATECYAKYAHS